ncbi:MAG TPA: allophanate hydrolase subunit 1 [Gemmata sp.]|jgi:inhibitor of KinA|nr:allophanate hydrolase subunit 1 [Gemmata sp.]
MTLTPLGDQAILAYLSDESRAILFAGAIRAAAPGWLQDVVPAYASVGVFFDADLIGTDEVTEWLKDLAANTEGSDQSTSLDASKAATKPRKFSVPVCYEMQLDMVQVCERTGLIADDVIRLHTSTEFTVYAIGFVPGFPYLGYLPPELCGVDRLPSPRLRIEPGSVGLTGRQTGIYPLARPGGWNLIGRTPRVIVDVVEGFFPLRVGDRVGFKRIDEAEYRRQEGEKLKVEKVGSDLL